MADLNPNDDLYTAPPVMRPQPRQNDPMDIDLDGHPDPDPGTGADGRTNDPPTIPTPPGSAGRASQTGNAGGNTPSGGAGANDSTQSADPAAGPTVTIGPAPEGNPQTRMARTPFAGPYESHFTLIPEHFTAARLKMLAHVNCSYLSTTGLPPTLTQLKKHAQSLAALIKELSIATKEGLIDNANVEGGDAYALHENESWDWLNNLQKPYENKSYHHNLPLTTVLNRLDPDWETSHEICPMHPASMETPPEGKSLPYADHMKLTQHATEILELLDHEYSAKGGLLSLLPGKDQVEDRKKAESTLLGQMILHLQQLTERQHNLECLYANALDILKGEAAAPHQTLSRIGPKGRQGREIVFPQDRFVLANAGDDIWQYLQHEFDRKEYNEKKCDLAYRRHGVSGDKLWGRRDGREFAKGITTLDVTTRYYRLRNDPLKTIFVIPAHQKHPNVRVTLEMEKTPTIVSVVKPVWPERASVLEMRSREDLKDFKDLKRTHAQLDNDFRNLTEANKLLSNEQKLNAGRIRELEKANETLKAQQIGDANKVRLNKVMEESRNATKAREEWVAARERAKKQKDEYTKKNKQLQQTLAAAEASKTKRELEEQLHREHADRERKRLDERDQDLQRANAELENKLKAVWQKQLTESQELIDFLSNSAIQSVLSQVKFNQVGKDDAANKVQAIIDNISSGTRGGTTV